MGGDQITLKRVAVVDRLEIDGTHLLALKGSLPGAYNGLIRLYIA
jgi:ribosomal protein L3